MQFFGIIIMKLYKTYKNKNLRIKRWDLVHISNNIKVNFLKNKKDQFADFRSFEENFNENDRLGVRTLRLQTLEDFCKASFTNVYQMPVFGSCRTLTR